MAIQVPPLLAAKIAEQPNLNALVQQAIADFSPWFDISGLPFFPDYTDHGPNHISGVLSTAEALIADDSWSVVSAADAAVLVLATLLHDAALHYREATF